MPVSSTVGTTLFREMSIIALSYRNDLYPFNGNNAIGSRRLPLFGNRTDHASHTPRRGLETFR